jgi:hypothetical protein
VKQEDPSKRKRFNKLTLRDISVVKSGGHQNAKILITRTEEEAPVSFLKQIMALFVASSPTPGVVVERSDGEAPTTSEILRVNEMRRNMMQVNGAFEESMWRIMNNCKGKDLVDKMKRSVEEYGAEMDMALSKVENLRRFITDDEVRALGKSLLTVSEQLAKVDDGAELSPTAVQEIQRSLKPPAQPEQTRGTLDKPDNANINTKENPMTLKEALAKATPAEIEELKRSLTVTPSTKTPEEILRGATAQLDPEVKKSIDAVLARNEELTRNTTTLVERLDRLEKERDDSLVKDKAKEFLSVMAEDKAIELVRSNNTTLIEIARERVKEKKALHESLTRERGNSNPPVGSVEASTAGEEIERKAKALMAEKPSDFSTLAEARVAVRNANPDLAKAERG